MCHKRFLAATRKHLWQQGKGQWPKLELTTVNPGSHSSVSISIHRQHVPWIAELIQYFYTPVSTLDFTSLSVGHKCTVHSKDLLALHKLPFNATTSFMCPLLTVSALYWVWTHTFTTNYTWPFPSSFLRIMPFSCYHHLGFKTNSPAFLPFPKLPSKY